MPESPLKITVYDKAMTRVGWLGDPQEVTATERHLAVGGATIIVPNDHRKLPILTAKGARIVIDYEDQTVLSGVLRGVEGEGGKKSGTVSCSFESDERLLWRMLAWPNPAAALSAQISKQDVREGPAETVLKGFVAANAARLGLPVTVLPDLGRGSTIKAGLRMANIGESLQPKLVNAGIGVTVRQNGTVLEVDCYEPSPISRLLTEDSGIVQTWNWSTQGPTVTRVVVAGQGEGTARAFTRVIAAATEADWGDLIEGFVDARDLEDDADLPARGQEALTEGRPLAGLSIELSETANFRYGKQFRVGDTVDLEVGPGITVADLLSEATMTWTRDNGFVASPTIGERTDIPTRKFVQAMAQLTRTVRKLTTI